jgi:hypothetical protein
LPWITSEPFTALIWVSTSPGNSRALVASINTPDTSNPALVGTPTFTFSGGGNSEFGAVTNCSNTLAGEPVRFAKPMVRLSFRQLF